MPSVRVKRGKKPLAKKKATAKKRKPAPEPRKALEVVEQGPVDVETSELTSGATEEEIEGEIEAVSDGSEDADAEPPTTDEIDEIDDDEGYF